jgi:hypothetical protein
MNPVAPWPTDPSEGYKMNERIFAGLEDLMKKGEIVEFGFFPDGISGFAISKGEATDVFRRVSMFQPYYLPKVNEIIPYEKGREISRAVMKARMEKAKK